MVRSLIFYSTKICIRVLVYSDNQLVMEIYLLGSALAGYETGGPGVLEVEASGNTVNIEDFAGEEKAGGDFALHGFAVDLLEFDAAGGDKLFFVGGLALHEIEIPVEFFGNELEIFIRDIFPKLFVREEFPKVLGELKGVVAGHALFRIGFFVL